MLRALDMVQKTAAFRANVIYLHMPFICFLFCRDLNPKTGQNEAGFT